MAATTTPTTQRGTMNKAALTGGPFFECNLHLFKNAVAISPNMELGNFEEADFGGYTPGSALDFGTSYIAPDGTVTLTAPGQDFVMTDDVSPQVIYGYFLTDADDEVLIGAENLLSPVPLSVPFQGLTVNPSVAYGQ